MQSIELKPSVVHIFHLIFHIPYPVSTKRLLNAVSHEFLLIALPDKNQSIVVFVWKCQERNASSIFPSFFFVCFFLVFFYSLGAQRSIHNEQPREHERVMKWKTFYRSDFVFDHVSWVEIHAMKLSTRLIHLFIHIFYIGNVHNANSVLYSIWFT